MLERVFVCPGCAAAYSVHSLPPRGQLFDCPRCGLLFRPAPRELTVRRKPTDFEPIWAEHGLDAAPLPPPPPSRSRRLAQWRDLALIYLSGLAMLGVAFTVVHLLRTGRPPRRP